MALTEPETVELMIRIHCKGNHRGQSGLRTLCPDCDDLLAYARERLARCPLHPRKPACSDCTVHCYRPDRREQIRAVMRYAGPRMMLHHPGAALRHLLRRLVARRPQRRNEQRGWK